MQPGVCAALPRRPGRSTARGFTLLELIIVVIVVGLLAGILLGRFSMYQEMAEKAAMEQMAGTIRSGLAMQVAGLVAHGRSADIPRLLNENPINLLAENPKNYAGEYYDADHAEIPAGDWYFDLKNHQLVYLVQRDAHFIPGKDGRKWVRYRLVAVHGDLPATPAGDSGQSELAGVALSEVEAYRWSFN